MRVLLLNGPNLSQLGSRDPAHYGRATLDDVVGAARDAAAESGAELEHLQTEDEAEALTRLHRARVDGTAAVVINAGAWTHYNLALRDAVELLEVPILELHLSNVHAREPFRRVSVLSEVCTGQIAGLGPLGYPLAVRAAVELARAAG